jgi:uncharacterized membrane protein YczE
MVLHLRQLWDEFKNAPPGERFARLYHRREARPSWVARSLFLAIGVVLMAIGLFLMVAPGPGTVVLILGAGVAAQESLRVARTMDWLERRIWQGAKWAVRWWRNRSRLDKTVLILTAFALAGSTGLAGYKLLAALYVG